MDGMDFMDGMDLMDGMDGMDGSFGEHQMHVASRTPATISGHPAVRMNATLLEKKADGKKEEVFHGVCLEAGEVSYYAYASCEATDPGALEDAERVLKSVKVVP